MKMENDVSAPKDGTVARILVTKGQTVSAGEPLFTMN
jgi:biotin carboxyl carrier protein